MSDFPEFVVKGARRAKTRWVTYALLIIVIGCICGIYWSADVRRPGIETLSPTPAPTDNPTLTPTTRAPTKNPTLTPTTKTPTKNPTTAAPTD